PAGRQAVAEPDTLDHRDFPFAALRRLDAVCVRFEEAWRSGEPPRLEDYLAGFTGRERAQLFRELVLLDLELRQDRGLPMPLDDYRPHFPEYAALAAEVLREAPPAAPADTQPGPSEPPPAPRDKPPDADDARARLARD